MSKDTMLIVGPLYFDLTYSSFNLLPGPGEEASTDEFTFAPGGLSITAINYARMGGKVSVMGVLGKDLFGNYIMGYLSREGVDTSNTVFLDSVGTAVSVGINHGDRFFYTYRGCARIFDENNALSILDVDKLEAEQIKHIHTGLHDKKLLNRMSSIAISKGITLSASIGHEIANSWTEGSFDSLRDLDVFVLNRTEAQMITDEVHIEIMLSKLKQYVRSVVVITDRDISYAIDGSGNIYNCSAIEASSVIDTTGAGDSFCSGFLRIYLETGNIAKALAFGNVCGGLCVQQMGGIIQDLTLEKVERIIRNLEKSQSFARKTKLTKRG